MTGPRKQTAKKRENRPRLDAILRAIKDGRFDDEIGQIQGAINDRNRKRQESVLALVQQTFGDGYTVTPTGPVVPGQPWQAGMEQPSIVSQPHPTEPVEGWKDETPFEKEPGEDDPDIESRSPIIG